MKIPTKASLIVLTLAAACAPAMAAPSAEDLIRQNAAALQSAASLKADFEEIDSYPEPFKDLAQRGTATLARPGQLRVDIHRFRRVDADKPWAASGNDTLAVSDGKTYWYAFLHPNSTQTRQEAFTGATPRAALRQLPALTAFFATGDAALPGQSGPTVLEADETWEGAKYHVVTYDVGSEGGPASKARAYLGDDSIVHRLVFTTQTPKGIATKEWNLRNIQVNAPAPASTFAYAPPADATPLNGSPRGAQLAEGAPAPDFTLRDAHGAPVKLSDYKGMTVVLEFWETWCLPCNQSLPHAQAISHANKDKNTVTLAVAIWDSQKGFDAWIKKHDYPDIRFAIDPSPQGKDVASSLYHIATTPTTFVIGPDGNVVKAIPGFNGKTDVLEAAIAAAQAPKTASAQ
ncbi:MAG: thiol:disulfide interchange protein [Capsulimonas sp.]|nr:thiol:disulfide interchange protein [Capsulimonas sp.]